MNRHNIIRITHNIVRTAHFPQKFTNKTYLLNVAIA